MSQSERDDRKAVPWGLIALIVFLSLLSGFTATNLEHRSDIALGVVTFRGVPVFLSALMAFTLGAVCVLPLTLLPSRRRRKRSGQARSSANAAPAAGDDGAEQGAAAAGGATAAEPPEAGES